MALLLDGSSGHLNCGDVLDGTTDMTVSAWMRRDAGASTTRAELLSKEGSGTPTGWELSVTETTTLAEFGCHNGGYVTVAGTTTLAIGTTYHLVGVRDSAAGLLRIYVNGVQENTVAAGAAPSASANALRIGNQAALDRAFDGYLEDVRFYNRALSAAEVQELYLARGRDKIFNGLQARWPMKEYPPGQTLSTGAGFSFSILNHQTASNFGGSFSDLTLSYTVPTGLSNPILVVCGGAEFDGAFSSAQPSSCTFGAGSMTKHVGTNTTATFGAGSAIFTLAVSANDSATITLTFPEALGSGNTGAILHAFVVEGGLATINTSTSGFNNSGNVSVGFTTSAASKLGITHHFTGDLNATTGPTGTGHTLIGEVLSNGASSGFSSRIGYFDAATAGSYSGMGFGFGFGPNRSAMSMIALDLAPTGGADLVRDNTISGFNAIPVGSIVSAESIGAL